jgi:hypothetical protein
MNKKRNVNTRTRDRRPAAASDGRTTWSTSLERLFLQRSAWLVALGIVCLTLLVYAPAISAGFIWDDDHYVTENMTLRSLAGLKQIWLDPKATPQYYPLVHTGFWVEYHLWGLDPKGYHLVNVLLHAANAVLVWLVLKRLGVPGALWAALIFALHPVHVESVAWVTERKNVLSTLFYLSAMLAYWRFWPADGAQPQTGAWRWYGLALLLFVFALLSKTVTCSLPAAILLIRWWKTGRLASRDWLLTAPMFAVGLALALLTVYLEKHHVGAQGEEFTWSYLDRVLIAGRAIWFYAGKLIWPSNLIFIYPRWNIDASVWWQYVFPLAAAGVVLALLVLRNRLGRAPLTAVLFFIGTLTPALGFFDVYPMRYSFVADHFQYLASLGLIVLFAGLSTELAGRLARRATTVARATA